MDIANSASLKKQAGRYKMLAAALFVATLLFIFLGSPWSILAASLASFYCSERAGVLHDQWVNNLYNDDIVELE